MDILGKLADILRSFQIVLATQSVTGAVSQQVAAGGSSIFAGAGRIDNLSNTAIQNPTITGGSISGTSIVGTVSSVINTAAATITDLVVTTINGVNANFSNATTTNLAVTGTAYFGNTVGVGTTSPFASFSVQAAPGQRFDLFAAASSSMAHVPYFRIGATGLTSISGRAIDPAFLAEKQDSTLLAGAYGLAVSGNYVYVAVDSR